MTSSTPTSVADTDPSDADAGPVGTIALFGNPNTGKTTLFNRLTGLRQKSANYPGTTIEAHIGSTTLGPDGPTRVVDLPGVYSIHLQGVESTLCRQVLEGSAAAPGLLAGEPDAVCVVVDATALREGLRFLGEIARFRLPIVVALTMLDVARRRGIEVDPSALQERLGCPVIGVNPRKGDGLPELRSALTEARVPRTAPGASEADVREWVDELQERSSPSVDLLQPSERVSMKFDRAFTHPVIGLGVFALIMTGLFWLLFRIATYPMDWIEGAFAIAGDVVGGVVPPGLIHDLLVGGVVPGIAGALVFLPQICLLFFLLSLLEDTGYLARAAFVADRLLRRFGLPGTAFIPLLSSHACAIPGIIAARSIPNRRERLATILVAPFMTCSARLPVYALLVSLLFAGRPALAALAFVGCYALGVVAGVLTALLARGTILRGPATHMTLELPSYKAPSVRTALLTAYDKGMVFLRKAGPYILAFSIVVWWCTEFPRTGAPEESQSLRTQAAQIEEAQPDEAAALLVEADRAESKHALANSFAGRMGRALEPVFAPLGFDWRLNIGVVTSFAAREVFVSTIAIVFVGDEEAAEGEGVIEAARTATRSDGETLVFTGGASWALLVFYVLAMQCFSTLVVTAKETGSAKWAVLQFTYMTAVAYLAALAARYAWIALS